MPCTMSGWSRKGGREPSSACRRASAGAREPDAENVTSPTKIPAVADCASRDVRTVQTSLAAALTDSVCDEVVDDRVATNPADGEDEEPYERRGSRRCCEPSAAGGGRPGRRPPPRGASPMMNGQNESAFKPLTAFCAVLSWSAWRSTIGWTRPSSAAPRLRRADAGHVGDDLVEVEDDGAVGRAADDRCSPREGRRAGR